MFNPFHKAIGDRLALDDLKQLIGNVAEGYVVEYKGDFPSSTAKIGHSIASLANTYGGWYIVGVETDEHHVASAIVGYDTSAHPDGVAKVREIVKTHIDPTPAFYPQVVEVEPGRAVLVTYVPGEQETPFITRDGRIYRRVHDSSTPVPESSRYTIDRLVEQGQATRRQFRNFRQDDRTFSEAEAGRGWVKLYLSPYPQDVTTHDRVLSRAAMSDLLTLSKSTLSFPVVGELTASGNIPFNNIQITPRSYLLRHVDPSLVGLNSLTVELFLDGRAKFFLQLPPYRPVYAFRDIESPEAKRAVDKIESGDRSYLLQFFDVAELSLHLAILIAFYKEWLGTQLSFTEMEFAATLESVWRAVPIFDSDEWGHHVLEYGLPVIGSDEVFIPGEEDQGYRIPWDSGTPEWMVISGFLYRGFGLPAEIFASSLAHAMLKVQQRETEKSVGKW